ncbi:157_t:CDS:2 [Rhizophagus irregularis]|nr:157_t:CDS:2 [Rhizophagus irregularis]
MLQDKAQMFNLNTSEMRLRGETWRLDLKTANIIWKYPGFREVRLRG